MTRKQWSWAGGIGGIVVLFLVIWLVFSSLLGGAKPAVERVKALDAKITKLEEERENARKEAEAEETSSTEAQDKVAVKLDRVAQSMESIGKALEKMVAGQTALPAPSTPAPKSTPEPKPKLEPKVSISEPVAVLRLPQGTYFNGTVASGMSALIAAWGDARAKVGGAQALQDAVGLSATNARADGAEAEAKRLNAEIIRLEKEKATAEAEAKVARDNVRAPWPMFEKDFKKLQDDASREREKEVRRLSQLIEEKMESWNKVMKSMKSPKGRRVRVCDPVTGEPVDAIIPDST